MKYLELKQKLAHEVDPKSISRILQQIADTPSIAYIGGTFDLFHPGHVHLLRQANMIADRVVVSLNTDEFCLEYKNKRPVMSLQERIDVIAACRYVYDVIVNVGGYDSKPSLLQINPDFIVHGDDWVGDDYLKQMGITREWLEKHNMQVVYIPYRVYDYDMSSSIIRKRLES